MFSWATVPFLDAGDTPSQRLGMKKMMILKKENERDEPPSPSETVDESPSCEQSPSNHEELQDHKQPDIKQKVHPATFETPELLESEDHGQ